MASNSRRVTQWLFSALESLVDVSHYSFLVIRYLGECFTYSIVLVSVSIMNFSPGREYHRAYALQSASLNSRKAASASVDS